MENPEAYELAEILWNYHRLNMPLHPADTLVVLGSYDTRPAGRAAELFVANMAPVVVFSGKSGLYTDKNLWSQTEAEVFSEIAELAGVPREKMLLEEQSTNTGDNIKFSEALLREKGYANQSWIIVTKPYMERRAFATFKKQFPDKECAVTSPNLSFEEFVVQAPEDLRANHMNAIVGDLYRIKEYPALGFQIPQEIPAEVLEAADKLIAMGYTKSALKKI